MDNFAALQEKVKTTLNQDLQANRIDVVKVMSALYLLSGAQNEQELMELIHTFKDDYVSLQTVMHDLAKAEKEDSDTDLQLVLSEMIKPTLQELKSLQNPDAVRRALAGRAEGRRSCC